MPLQISEGRPRFDALVEAEEKHDRLLANFQVDYDPERNSVAGLRRRRRRAANVPDTPVKTVSLVEEDGVLYWRDGVPAPAPSLHGRRARRRRSSSSGADDEPDAGGTIVLTKEFPVLKPNKVIDAIGAIDIRLNPAIEKSLRSRLRPLRQPTETTFSLDEVDATGPFSGRTLVFVHGTFSSSANMLREFAATPRGRKFLGGAMMGPAKYDNVVFFDHATLSISPVINALELGRALAGSTGQIDVIAHSRGGLVVRWWLEAFGNSLRLTNAKPVRAVLAGAPLYGTSLAAPDKLQTALSLISNVGTFASAMITVTGWTNPFIWVGGKLVEVVVSVTGALARTPLIDGLVALVPGLSGQAMVSNNQEINRLRLGPCAVDPCYFAIQSNFETKDPGWRFWRNFRKDRLGDLAADAVFPGKNDLVVDTASMTNFGVPKLKLAGETCDYRTSDTVWHCNYFQQDRTIDYIEKAFR
jgi:pimeloyl-ACP methyl ester carboxylesterase